MRENKDFLDGLDRRAFLKGAAAIAALGPSLLSCGSTIPTRVQGFQGLADLPYFELDADSPYMLLVAPVKEERQVAMNQEEEALFGIEKLNVPRSDMPAVTHVDYSARVQTVRRDENQPYYDVIQAFYSLTGYPVVVNTSFNVRGEPIVNTPEEAYRCFMRTEMDYLVLGNFLLDKEAQPQWQEEKDWQEEFELD